MDKPLFDMKNLRLPYNGVPSPFELTQSQFHTGKFTYSIDHESCNVTGHVTLNMQKLKGKYLLPQLLLFAHPLKGRTNIFGPNKIKLL